MKDKTMDLFTRLWFSLLMLLFFIILTVKFSVGQSLEIKQASRFADVDQEKKALNALNEAVRKYPTDPIVRYYLGMAELKNNRRDLASASFDKGIGLDDKEPLNYVGRGYLSMLEGNLQKAELDFAKALTLSKSKNVVVLKVVSKAYLRDTNLADKALTLLQKAKTIDDHDAEIFILLGDAYLAQNNGGLAVTNYERAATLDAGSAKPHYGIGLVYLRSRNFSAAQEAFNKAIQVDPGFTLAHKELGELYYQMKDGKNAVKAYDTYLSLTDNPDEGKLRYAFFLFMAKEFQKANNIFSTLVGQPNTSPTTLRFYALSLFEAGDFQESKNVFDTYFSSVPSPDLTAPDYNFYGKLLIKQNKDSLAIDAFQKSLLLDESQPEILQLTGETLFKLKNFVGAIATYEKLMGMKPKMNSQDLYTVGRAYYFNKQYDKAESIFEKLIELQSNMTIGYLWQARVKSNLDPESENGFAKPYYEKLVEKSSTTPEKNKNDLLEAYSYLGYYHFLKAERDVSRSYWRKVLELSPADAKAKEALKALE